MPQKKNSKVVKQREYFASFPFSLSGTKLVAFSSISCVFCIFRQSPSLRSGPIFFTCLWKSWNSLMILKSTCGDPSSSTTSWRESTERSSCRTTGAFLPAPSVAPPHKSGLCLRTVHTENAFGWQRRSTRSSTCAASIKNVAITI